MKINEFHILLIDDDEDDYVNLRGLFEEIPGTKYHIEWKSNYQAGLEAFREKKFDVCLLDYRLGELTGIDLLKEVEKQSNACPIILLTGHSDFDLDVQAMQMGASEYLVKGQLTAPLLERSIRYTMKHAMDMEELKESKAQIVQQDRLASLGLLASSLAHEIGTPLGIIRSRAEMIGKKAPSAETLKQDMQTITFQIDRIAKLVHALLNLARSKQSEFTSAVNLNQVINDVLVLMQHEFASKDIAVEFVSANEVFVKAEAGPLGQVILNLLMNSMHAIEEVQKTAVDRKHRILILVEEAMDFVDIIVQDTGCGISDENRTQIFRPFFTTKDIGHGTGLGLAVSYKIIHSWEGTIAALSQPGEGATFKIRLIKAHL